MCFKKTVFWWKADIVLAWELRACWTQPRPLTCSDCPLERRQASNSLRGLLRRAVVKALLVLTISFDESPCPGAKSTEVGLSYWLKYVWFSRCTPPKHLSKVGLQPVALRSMSLSASQTDLSEGSQWIIFTQGDVRAFFFLQPLAGCSHRQHGAR